MLSRKELSKLKTTELKKICKSQGCKDYKHLSKKELVKHCADCPRIKTKKTKKQVLKGVAKFNKIDGPVSFTAVTLPNQNNKLVLLFGDQHDLPQGTCNGCSMNRRCTTLFNWLMEYFESVTVCTDLFLEFSTVFENVKYADMIYRHQLKVGGDLLINQILSRFGDCIRNDEKCQEQWGNMRVHMTDARDTSGLYEFFTTFKEINEEYELTNKDLDNMKNIIYTVLRYYIGAQNILLPGSNKEVGTTEQELEYLNTMLKRHFGQYSPNFKIKHIANTRRRFQKQLDGIDDENMRNKIIDYIVENINSLHDQTQTVDDLGSYMALVMDIYLLPRLFKQSLDDSQISIIYAGDEHIERYAYFLTGHIEDSKVLVNHSYELDVKCIKLSKQEQKRLSDHIYKKIKPHECSRKKRELFKS